MQLTTVESSMIYAVGYDPENRTLEVVFNSGEKYQYYDVPQEEYEGLMAADSKGRYMRAYIIDEYDWAPVKRWRR
ncbi:MAG: KTSC domain-containing protein [Candidatus Poribacteria bacterium]|nr:KTSC domain-containing protein [Candidatus Poribacteria bacterium]